MQKVCFEYIWIDGFNNTRSKLKVMEFDISFSLADKKIILEKIPEWNFDGSSTGQAEGKDSDILLKPINIYINPFISWCTSFLILCECFNKDGTPHVSNTRAKLVETYNKCVKYKPWFGIEQEYVLMDVNKTMLPNNQSDIVNAQSSSPLLLKPYKWMNNLDPGFGPQGPYYCGVGGNVCFGRNITLEHLEYCMKMGLSICGTNGEVMCSQWEYQLGPADPVELSDQLFISRYVLNRITEKYNCWVSFEPKPHKDGNWNGSGGHTNFSTELMRNPNGLEHIKFACEKLALTHEAHIKVYGKNNEERLTGINETSSINNFSWGISDRGKSIRIPLNVVKEGCGYLEDRRPAANLDPYLVTEIICRTICID